MNLQCAKGRTTARDKLSRRVSPCAGEQSVGPEGGVRVALAAEEGLVR